MKQNVIVAAIALSAGVFLGWLIAGTSRTGSPPSQGVAPVHSWTNESKTVGYVLPNDGPYYDLKWQGVERKLTELGYQAQKYSAGGYKNVKAQTDIMDALIQKKVAGIILHPVDGKALAPFVERAYDNGIPVIAENVDISSPHLAGSVQLADEQNGWEIAMALVNELHGQGKIVVFVGPAGQSQSDAMWKSAKEYLSRFQKIEVVREEYLPANAPAALKDMETILTAHKDIDGVYAWYIENAIGAIQAIKNAGYEPAKIKVVCKDISPQGEVLMREGYLNACLVGEPILMGEKSAEMLDSIIKGATSGQRVVLRNRLVTLSTLDSIDRSKFQPAK